jgi:hypothetical protein
MGGWLTVSLSHKPSAMTHTVISAIPVVESRKIVV